MKKLISIILVAVMLCSTFAAITVSAEGSAEPTYSETVTLTAADFTPVGTDSPLTVTLESGKKYVLSEDVDLSGKLYSNVLLETAEGAMLDGQGHTFYVDGSGSNFHIDAKGGIVQNVNFGSKDAPFYAFCHLVNKVFADTENTWKNVNFSIADKRRIAKEAFAGFSREVLGSISFIDCNMYMELEQLDSWNDKLWAGWLGTVNNANAEIKFENCTTDGYMRLRFSRVAGYIANVVDAKSVEFKNCTNSMDLSTNYVDNMNVPYVAGFVRMDDSNSTVRFENCVNYGDMTGKVTAGILINSRGNSELVNCVNYGKIHASLNGAGVVTRIYGGTTSTISILGSENYGGVTGAGTGGGIFTFVPERTVTATVTMDECLSIGDVTTETVSGGLIGAAETHCTPTVTNSYAFSKAAKAVIGAGSISAESTGNFTLSTYTDAQGATAKTVAEAVEMVNADDFKLNDRAITEPIKADATGTKVVIKRDIPVESMAIDQTSVSIILNSGEDVTLVALVSPSYASSSEVTWSSSDTSVVKVENGKLIPVAYGTAIITVSSTADPTKTATCEVKIEDPVGEVIYKINQIPNPVTLSSRLSIVAAENAYAALETEMKALVTNYQVLLDARTAYNALVDEQKGGGKKDNAQTEANTEAAETNAVTEAPATEADTGANEEKKGCGSSVLGGVAIVGAVAACACLSIKKKED